MTAEQELEYDQLPSVTPLYLRAATTLSGGLSEGETIPDITARLPGMEARADSLAKYRKVCGFEHSQRLPITYPHVMAFPLHLAVMTDKQFPLKLLGLIHLRNDITQYRAIAADESLDLTVSVGGHRDVEKGIEFDLVTRFYDSAGELVWDETGTMLSKQSSGSKSGGKKKKKQEGLPFEPAEETQWDVPEDIGRQYAGAAGDYNPIHLSPWSAKLFGFPRAIATGMWVKARAAAALGPELNTDAYTLSVGFKKPVFLPGRVRFAYAVNAQGADFGLTNDKGDIFHLLGEIRYL